MEETAADQQSVVKTKDIPVDWKGKVYNIAKKTLFKSNKSEKDIKMQNVRVVLLKEPNLFKIWRKQQQLQKQLGNDGKDNHICENSSVKKSEYSTRRRIEVNQDGGGLKKSCCFGVSLCSWSGDVVLNIDPKPRFVITNKEESGPRIEKYPGFGKSLSCLHVLENKRNKKYPGFGEVWKKKAKGDSSVCTVAGASAEGQFFQKISSTKEIIKRANEEGNGKECHIEESWKRVIGKVEYFMEKDGNQNCKKKKMDSIPAIEDDFSMPNQEEQTSHCTIPQKKKPIDISYSRQIYDSHDLDTTSNATQVSNYTNDSGDASRTTKGPTIPIAILSKDGSSTSTVSSRQDNGNSVNQPSYKHTLDVVPLLTNHQNQINQVSEEENIPNQESDYSSTITNNEIIELDSENETEAIDGTETNIQITNDLPDNVTFNFVCIEIESLQASNSSCKEITQIGGVRCYKDNTHSKFFRVIEPENLNYYLENYKMGGDLLQTLHIQKNDCGKFEFRKPFEILKEGKEAIKCVNEEVAFEALSSFLGCVNNCVLISLSKDNIELLVKKMQLLGSTNQMIHTQTIKGFCSWTSYLEQSGASREELSQDFDDWYIEKVKRPIASKPYADAVARMVKRSIKNACNKESVYENLVKASYKIESLLVNQMSNDVKKPETSIDYLEIVNSLRPTYSVIISLQKFETYDISSDEDWDESYVDLVMDEKPHITGNQSEKVNYEGMPIMQDTNESNDDQIELDVSYEMLEKEAGLEKGERAKRIGSNTNDERSPSLINKSALPKETKRIACPVCHKKLASVKERNQHIILLHNPNKSQELPVLPSELQCKKCYMWFPSFEQKAMHTEAGQHKKEMETPLFLKCQGCNGQFRNFYSKSQHMLSQICHKRFTSIQGKNQHCADVHKRFASIQEKNKYFADFHGISQQEKHQSDKLSAQHSQEKPPIQTNQSQNHPIMNLSVPLSGQTQGKEGGPGVLELGMNSSVSLNGQTQGMGRGQGVFGAVINSSVPLNGQMQGMGRSRGVFGHGMNSSMSLYGPTPGMSGGRGVFGRGREGFGCGYGGGAVRYVHPYGRGYGNASGGFGFYGGYVSGSFSGGFGRGWGGGPVMGGPW